MRLNARLLAILFAFYASLSVLLLASFMPPYMNNGDEWTHFSRADQIANGGFVASPAASAPANIDTGVYAGWTGGFVKLQQDHSLRSQRVLYAPLPWGERTSWLPYLVAVYPPVMYLPAAAGIKLGKAMGLTVLPAMELARAASGLSAVMIGTAAIALAGTAAPFFFALLTLPMVLSQMAGVDQDGLIMALSALAAVLSARLIYDDIRRPKMALACLALVLAAIGAARPPYIMFCVLPMLATGVSWRHRTLASGFATGAVMLWSAIVAFYVRVDMVHFNNSIHADAHAQIVILLHDPTRLVIAIAAALAQCGHLYFEEFVGILGFLDIRLAAPVYSLAPVALISAVAASLGGGASRRWTKPYILIQAVTWGAMLAACGAVFAIQYFEWTPPGAAMVAGIQGRYFIPVVMFAAVTLYRPLIRPVVFSIFSIPVMIFSVIAMVATMHALMLRYYL